MPQANYLGQHCKLQWLASKNAALLKSFTVNLDIPFFFFTLFFFHDYWFSFMITGFFNAAVDHLNSKLSRQ